MQSGIDQALAAKLCLDVGDFSGDYYYLFEI
jgi:hypothetical protein